MRHMYDDTPEHGRPAPRRTRSILNHPARRSPRGGAAAAMAVLVFVCAGSSEARQIPGSRLAVGTRSTPSSQAAPPAPRVLTLDEALAIAEKTSEQVTIAEAGVTRAESEQRRVRSEWMPQLSASASYDRALASEFEGIFENTGAACTPFTLNPQAPLTDRVAEIERALRDCPPTGNLFGGGETEGDDTSLPFGRANTYRVNLAFTQNVYTGGRLSAQQARARIGRVNAGLTVTTTRAQVSLDVAQAYFDALLSDRLVAIAEATLAQADQTAAQVRQQREAGRVAEFDQLRAQVTRDALRPDVIRRRNDRDVAYLRLKQLLELPLDTPLQLAGDLELAVLPPPAARFAEAIASAEAAPSVRPRTAVAQAENEVHARQADVRIARAQRLPAVSVSSSYGRVAYAGLPSFGDFRTNWTIGAAAQVPIFTGGRIKADEIAARASLTETQARLQLARELATLDEASARLQLANARAAWDATAGTIQQAVRAYEIAELRYREGLSTQLELSDARLLLQQAQANRAQAARDVQIARVRLAVLPELPLDAAASAAAGAAAPGGAQQPPAARQQTPTAAPGTAAGGGQQ
jgi:outer membrane protein